MSRPTVLGYAAKAAGEPLAPLSYESPELGDHGVRVRVTHCGLCYTDVHGIDDYYEISTYPFVPGHEIVGLVEEAGPAVTELATGDRVGIGWQGRACWECEWCRRGEEQLCADLDNSGTWKPYGGFADSVVVDSRFAYRLPETMPSDTAAVLMCAGIAVFAPLHRYARDGARHVGVLGIGGLGHLAIQFAHALGAEVTAVSSTPEKEQEARGFGADHFVVADEASLRSQQGAFDLVLSTMHGKTSGWERLIMTLKRRGRLVVVGFPQITLDAMEVVVRELSITGSLLGSRAEMREMLDFAHAHAIKPAVELMPMSAVNEAIQRLRDNRVRYRVVLVNDARTATG
jgi:uncharacterized zinc-type alcohol dehydrogenase-like protein